MTTQIHILGPQRPPNLAQVVDKFLPEGPLALVTAGWRHDEQDISALERDLDRPLYLLPLYRWFDQLGMIEPELSNLHRQRQNQIMAYKKVYRLQLRASFDLWHKVRELYALDPQLYADDEKDACSAVRMTDKRAFERINDIRSSYPSLLRPWEHPSAENFHYKIARTLDACSGILFAGGHVAILRNRLYFFGFDVLLRQFLDAGKQIVAWSAGAMSLTDRIILYYDNPPDGIGIPELLDSGLGLIKDTIFLPHATERLDTHKTHRMPRFARRFSPTKCIGLAAGDHLQFDRHGQVVEQHGGQLFSATNTKEDNQ